MYKTVAILLIIVSIFSCNVNQQIHNKGVTKNDPLYVYKNGKIVSPLIKINMVVIVMNATFIKQ